MRHRGWVLVLVMALSLGACDAGALDEEDPPPGLGDIELVPYSDERLSFLYPGDWDVTIDDEDQEHKVRVELRPRGSDHLHALITAVWPLPPHEDLKGVTELFGRTSDSPGVSGFRQEPIDVTGAEEAVVQQFRSTRAVVGHEVESDVWVVLARSSGDRALGFTVLVVKGSGIHAESLAEEVIPSLQVKEWDEPKRPQEPEGAEGAESAES